MGSASSSPSTGSTCRATTVVARLEALREDRPVLRQEVRGGDQPRLSSAAGRLGVDGVRVGGRLEAGVRRVSGSVARLSDEPAARCGRSYGVRRADPNASAGERQTGTPPAPAARVGPGRVRARVQPFEAVEPTGRRAVATWDGGADLGLARRARTGRQGAAAPEIPRVGRHRLSSARPRRAHVSV